MQDLIEDIFEKTGRQWKVDDNLIQPTQDDILKLLDEAAKRLYSEQVGTRLEKGGLIVEKKHRGHDVYVMVGSYE